MSNRQEIREEIRIDLLCLNVDEVISCADTERHAKAIQQKLDRLDEAFLFAQSIDIDTYDRHRDKLRQELTRIWLSHNQTNKTLGPNAAQWYALAIPAQFRRDSRAKWSIS